MIPRILLAKILPLRCFGLSPGRNQQGLLLHVKHYLAIVALEGFGVRTRRNIGLFILLFLLIPSAGLADSPADYQNTLGKFYDECSRTVYENYIRQGYEAVYWGKLENETGYDLAILYNDSIINRINTTNRREENRSFEIAEKTEAQIKGLKTLFKQRNPAPYTPDINKIAIAEIIVSEVKPAADNNFSLKLNLRITTRRNAARPFILARTYNGRDSAIANYIIKKQYSPLATFSFIGLTLIVVIALVSIPKLKRHKILREENISFFIMGCLIYLGAILVFCGLAYLKYSLIRSSAFFKGAEVNFFVDTNAGLYFEPQPGKLNFTQTSNLLSRKIFDKISASLYTGRSLSEEMTDSIIYFINKILDLTGLKSSRLENFLELKKSDYFYKFYTFTFDDNIGEDKLKPLSQGRFGEVATDFEQNLAQISLMHHQNKGQSSLIKPLLQLIKQTEERKAAADAPGKMKQFIIILTDADEGYERNIKELLGHIGSFYTKKDQYLRVFSILFPNLPKSEDKIYYYETGKLVLLSKISEMIVNLNANRSFTADKFRRENELYYRKLHINMDERLERQYDKKLDELKVFTKGNRVPSLKEIAGQYTLMDYIRDKERQYIKLLGESSDYMRNSGELRNYQDFFIYTYADNMYCMEHKGKSMSSTCDRQEGDCGCNGLEFDQSQHWTENEDIKVDYNTTRTSYFSLKNDTKAAQDLNLINDVLIDQFIFISFDKEQLAESINNWLPFLTILLGLTFAWLLYRYKYHVNYKFGWYDFIAYSSVMGIILLVQLALYIYIQYTRENWLIYGSLPQALIVSMGFAICVYIVPQLINLALLKKFSGEADILFSFNQTRWLANIDRYLFDFIFLPVMTISIFLILGFPVLKPAVTESKDWLTQIIGFMFEDYNNIIDVFIITWGIVGLMYIIRSMAFSKVFPKHRPIGD